MNGQNAVEHRMAELEEQVRQLTSKLSSQTESKSTEDEAAPRVATRRNVLRVAGATAVGAAAGLIGSRPAAAVDGGALTIGQIQTAESATFLRYGTATNSGGPALTSERLMMWFDNRNSPNAGAAGVRGDGKADGYGVFGNNDFGGVGVDARSSGAGPALFATAADGEALYAEGRHGIHGNATEGYALRAGQSGKASVFLTPGTKTAPPSRTDAHDAGELESDASGNLWWCAVSGTPGTWRKIAGPASAGTFNAIDPVRAFDSRQSAYPNNGLFLPNTNRVISIKDGRNASGTITVPNAVPAGATAIAYNVTVTGTTGPNYLSVVPGNATSFTTSSINWSGADQSLANGLIVKIDGSRQVRIFCGDQTGSTHAILDISGYWI